MFFRNILLAVVVSSLATLESSAFSTRQMTVSLRQVNGATVGADLAFSPEAMPEIEKYELWIAWGKFKPDDANAVFDGEDSQWQHREKIMDVTSDVTNRYVHFSKYAPKFSQFHCRFFLRNPTLTNSIPENLTFCDYLGVTNNALVKVGGGSGYAPSTTDLRVQAKFQAGSDIPSSTWNTFFSSREAYGTKSFSVLMGYDGDTKNGANGLRVDYENHSDQIYTTEGTRAAVVRLDRPCYLDIRIQGKSLTWSSYYYTDSATATTGPKNEYGHSFEATTNVLECPLYLFGLVNGTATADANHFFRGRLYELSFTEEGVVKHALVPAKQDGVMGLYDLAAKEFLSAATGGPFADADGVAPASFGVASDVLSFESPILYTRTLASVPSLASDDVTARGVRLTSPAYDGYVTYDLYAVYPTQSVLVATLGASAYDAVYWPNPKLGESVSFALLPRFPEGYSIRRYSYVPKNQDNMPRSTTFINTDYHPNASTEFAASFTRPSNNDKYNVGLCCARTSNNVGSNPDGWYSVFVAGNKIRFDFGKPAALGGSTFSLTAWKNYDIVCSRGQVFARAADWDGDGATYGTLDETSEYTCPYKMRLFASYNDGSKAGNLETNVDSTNCSEVYIFAVRVKDSGGERLMYQPAVNGSGEVGFYDYVTKSFVKQSRGSAFSAGNPLMLLPQMTDCWRVGKTGGILLIIR